MYYTVIHMPTTQQRQIISLSLPPVVVRDLDRLVKSERKTRSELLREALRIYTIQKNFDIIDKYGEKIAAKLGIETYDDVERIGG